MKNIFKETVMNRVKYSKFDLTHDRKFSCNMGELVPIMCAEVLPGDIFNLTSEQMIRLAPMLAPIMHRVDVYTHFFFVPNRIVWDGWEDFISPADPSDTPEFPILDAATTPAAGSIADYLGLPTGEPLTASAIPFAAYAKIYNEYYRDQNLITEVTDTCADGENNAVLTAMAVGSPFYRCWEHDYFTACLPFAQKGDPVQLPLGGSAEINFTPNGNDNWYVNDGGLTPVDGYDFDLGGAGFNPPRIPNTSGDLLFVNTDNSNEYPVSVDNSQNLSADLSTATGATINEFRRAIRLQEWLEKNARGGTRYIENILSHFGVRSPDQRLQRPEYLGGGRSPVMISEILQTSATDSEPTPQGTMSGHGINVGQSHAFKKRFVEHGYIIGIMSVMPKTAYFQGIPRHWFKFETLDFAFPSFAHIGEQEVYNKEVHAGHATPDGTFGYIPRYSEYRYLPSTVHGDFRTSLDFWHMGRDLPDTVALNAEFVTSDPTTRIFAVEDGTDTLWCHVLNVCTAVRPLPKYGIPTV